jgi:hypothetical protein
MSSDVTEIRVTADANDLLVELRRLAERFPLPHPLWHRYVPEMLVVVRDLFFALDAIATCPPAQRELLLHVEGEAASPPEDAGGPAIAAVRARLRDLPIPSGEHPYLDEIVVTLEAANAAFAALTVAGGDEAFVRRVQEG